jgi:metal-responsive CopG/Arc/MetJ family transcriptional regulator
MKSQSIRFPDDLHQLVDWVKRKHGHSSFTDAIHFIIRDYTQKVLVPEHAESSTPNNPV